MWTALKHECVCGQAVKHECGQALKHECAVWIGLET